MNNYNYTLHSSMDYLKNVALCLYNNFMFYLGTSQMHPGGGYTSIPLSHCEDTPTHSPHCQCSSGHRCGRAALPQCSFLEWQWILERDFHKRKQWKAIWVEWIDTWLCIWRNVVSLFAMLPAKSPGERYVCMHFVLYAHI